MRTFPAPFPRRLEENAAADPQHAAVPIPDNDVSRRGTMRPTPADGPRRAGAAPAMCRPISSNFTINPTHAVDRYGDPMATTASATPAAEAVPAETASAIAMISADRMKSVRIAPLTWRASSSAGVSASANSASADGRRRDFGDFLGRFERQRAPPIINNGVSPTAEGRQQHRRGKADQQFIFEAADGDLAMIAVRARGKARRRSVA